MIVKYVCWIFINNLVAHQSLGHLSLWSTRCWALTLLAFLPYTSSSCLPLFQVPSIQVFPSVFTKLLHVTLMLYCATCLLITKTMKKYLQHLNEWLRRTNKKVHKILSNNLTAYLQSIRRLLTNWQKSSTFETCAARMSGVLVTTQMRRLWQVEFKCYHYFSYQK